MRLDNAQYIKYSQVAELVDAERNIGNTLFTGSNPVLTTINLKPKQDEKTYLHHINDSKASP